MKNLIIGLVLSISPLFLLAHNPLSARYYLHAGEQASILNISLSQAGVNQALLKKYGQDELHQMEQKEFKEVIIAYLKEHFYLAINQQEIKLEEGGIKLGNHQTDLKFVLPPLPKEVVEIAVRIPAFQENDQHQTIFSYNLFGEVDKLILGTKNDYQARVKLKEASESSFYFWPIQLGLLVLAGGLHVFYAYFYKNLHLSG